MSGGSNSGVYLSTAEFYDPLVGSFVTTGSVSTPRHYHTATLLPNGKVLILGGNNSGGELSTAEFYDPRRARSPPRGACQRCGTIIRRLFFRTGRCSSRAGITAVSIFRRRSSMIPQPAHLPPREACPRRGVSCGNSSSEREGAHLGGYNGSEDLSTAELYDPSPGSFAAMGSMSTPRSRHAAALLPTGRFSLPAGQRRCGSSHG